MTPLNLAEYTAPQKLMIKKLEELYFNTRISHKDFIIALNFVRTKLERKPQTK